MQQQSSECSKKAGFGDDDLLAGFAFLASHLLDRRNDVHSGGDASEDYVFTVQPGRFGRAEEELASVRVGAGIGHGEDAGSDVLLDEILVGELFAVDGLAAGAVAAGKVASLAHEAGNDAVEGGPRIAEPLLPCAESAEVLAGFWNDVSVQLHHDAPGLLSVNRYVEEDFWLCHFLRGCGSSRRIVTGLRSSRKL